MTPRPGETNLNISSSDLPPDQASQLGSVSHFQQNEVLKRSHRPIKMMGCLQPDPLVGGKPVLSGMPNPSVAAISAELLDGFKGPLLFTGRCADLDTMDFRHIVDHLHAEYDWAVREREAQDEGYIVAVRVNCLGDIMVLDRPLYEPCKVADNFFHPEEKHLIPVTAKLGLPLVTHSVPAALTWKNRTTGPKGLHYHMNMGFSGLNPDDWKILMGTVQIARKDKKPLHVAHVEALIGYLILIGGGGLEAEMDKTVEGDAMPGLDAAYREKSQLVMARACKVHFVEYLEKWMEKIGRPRYGNVGSPYDV